MKNKLSIDIITQNNMCISCGSCIHICPFDNIRMQYSDIRGKWDAIVQNKTVCLKCNGYKNCLYVCPSYNTDYTVYGSEENDYLGRIEQVYNGWSKNEKVRKHSSSGGFIRELCNNIMTKNKDIKIISIVHHGGFEYFPKILNDCSDTPNSIYHNINFENAFEIIKKENKQIVLIGLPCQLMGVNLLLSKSKYRHLRDKITLKVSLICGYTFERVNMKFFAAINNINMKEVTYRENGRYRKTRLKNEKNSVTFDVMKPKNIKESINNIIAFDKWLVQKNCLFCVDHLGYCSDLVVGDAWQQRYNSDKIGTNIIICRTKKGLQFLKQMSEIQLENGNKNEIIESQGEYAQPFYGIGNKKFVKSTFVPDHKVGNKTLEKIRNISLKDKVKVNFIKKIFYEEKYKILKFFYIMLEIKYVMKLIIKKLIRRN